jgi:hypothetical protein
MRLLRAFHVVMDDTKEEKDSHSINKQKAAKFVLSRFFLLISKTTIKNFFVKLFAIFLE